MATYNIRKDLDLAGGGKVAKKRKSPAAAIALTAIGLLTVAAGYLPAVAGNVNHASAVMILGWCIAVPGVILLVVNAAGGNSWEFIYTPGNRKLRRYELSFPGKYRDRVHKYVAGGDFDKLAELERSNAAAIKVLFYALPGKDILFAQIFEFVPHTHVPSTEIIGYEEGRCPMPEKLA